MLYIAAFSGSPVGERVREVRGVTGVPLTVVNLPVFQPLASFSERAKIENFVVRTELRAKLLVTSFIYSQPALNGMKIIIGRL